VLSLHIVSLKEEPFFLVPNFTQSLLVVSVLMNKC